jgi:hypothetical protein
MGESARSWKARSDSTKRAVIARPSERVLKLLDEA